MLAKIAKYRSKTTTGITKVRATIIFEAKVENEELQISSEDDFSDSREICIPSASENPSAIAIVITPPITANFELVPAVNPTISPNVVIIPEVIPNPKPDFTALVNLKIRFIEK